MLSTSFARLGSRTGSGRCGDTLGQWGHVPGKSRPRTRAAKVGKGWQESKVNKPKVTRGQIFFELVRKVVPKEKIDGLPTPELF